MAWSSASGRNNIESALRRVGGMLDNEVDLAETALLFAALDQPKAPLDRYVHHLSLLTRDVAEEGARLAAHEDLSARLAAINGVIYGRYGYEGDDESYDDLDNANLMRVIDRRRGLPVALGILYIHSARAQGWAIEGLAFPGHFLLRMECGGERAIIDPFNKGERREPEALRGLLKLVAGNDVELSPQHYASLANRQILLRLQNNRKVRLLHAGRNDEALDTLETMIMIAPDQADLWREAGMINAELSNLRAAIVSLENFLQLAPGNHRERLKAEQYLRQLRNKLN